MGDSQIERRLLAGRGRSRARAAPALSMYIREVYYRGRSRATATPALSLYISNQPRGQAKRQEILIEILIEILLVLLSPEFMSTNKQTFVNRGALLLPLGQVTMSN